MRRILLALALVLAIVTAGPAPAHATSTYDFSSSCQATRIYNGTLVGGFQYCQPVGMGGVTPYHHYRVMIQCRNSETGAQTGWLYGNTGGAYPSNPASSRYCPASTYTLSALTAQILP